MSLAALEARAEVLKLAYLLGVGTDSLDYLDGAAPADLAALREQITDLLFDGDRQTLKRVADAAAYLPVGLLATIAEKGIGPLLCGRLTGVIDTDRAVAVAGKLSSAFLAEVAKETDPRRAPDIIAGIPTAQIIAVGEILVAEGDHVALGRFAGFVSDEALAATARALSDTDLLRVTFVLEGKDRLDKLIALLPDERLATVMQTAADAGLWPEALDLLAHLGDAQLARVSDLAGPAATAAAEEQARTHDVELRLP